jgi:hypothetical protein
MTTDETRAMLELLFSAYPQVSKSKLDGAVTAWQMILKDYPAQDLMRVVINWIKSETDFPKVADIIHRLEGDKVIAPTKPRSGETHCWACLDTGIVSYTVVHQGREYEYAARCNCSAARQYEANVISATDRGINLNQLAMENKARVRYKGSKTEIEQQQAVWEQKVAI